MVLLGVPIGPTWPIYELNLTLDLSYLCTKYTHTAGYDILFAYFVVGAKSKMQKNDCINELLYPYAVIPDLFEISIKVHVFY